MSDENWKVIFSREWLPLLEDDLSLYKNKGNILGLFALQLKFDIDNIEQHAVEIITDGSDDKKCDLIYTDTEKKIAIIAQCYFSSSENSSAKSNKASDLNTAISWVFNASESSLPEIIKQQVCNLRDALKNNEIEKVYIHYIHNLNESDNVTNELNAIVKPNILKDDIQFIKEEIGVNRIAELYNEASLPILINEDFEIDIKSGNEQSTNNWEAYSTAIPVNFLFDQFRKYEEKIFSANIREYLGSSRNNVNNGIRETLNKDAENFWVYNNGITILTHDLKIDNGKVKIKGLSIVNGAQTTGSIGSIRVRPSDNVYVQARFIAVKNGDHDLVHKIIQYNNSQNKIEAPDFRSTDPIQKRLTQEFKNINNCEYRGGRRGGGIQTRAKRNPYLLDTYTVAQSIASFHLKPNIAYNEKSKIWINDSYYSMFFNEKTTAKHIIFCYSLYLSLQEKKKYLKSIFSCSETKEGDKELYKFFQKRGSIPLLSSAISRSLETITNEAINDKFSLCFKENINHTEALSFWKKIVDKACKLAPPPLSEAASDNVKTSSKITNGINAFSANFDSLFADEDLFSDFKEKISYN